jgi:WD40 repeat protein
MASMASMASHHQQHRVVSSKRLAPRVTISDNTAEMFAVRWSPDGKYVAAGAGDGNICVFSADTGAVAFQLQQGLSSLYIYLSLFTERSKHS